MVSTDSHSLASAFFSRMAFTDRGILSQALAQEKCFVSAIRAMAPEDTTIGKAESLAEPTPHCRIDSYVITRNPGPNQVHFRLQLPDNDRG